MKKIKILIILFFILILFNCKKKEAYFFINRDYYYVYEDEYRILKLIQKKLEREFYKVDIIYYRSISSINYEIDKVINNNNNILLVLNDYISPFLIKNENIPGNRIKAITYNVPNISADNGYNYQIFNINIDHIILKDKIIRVLKEYSKDVKLSDCSIIINKNFYLSSIISEELTRDGYAIETIFNFNAETVKKWIDDQKKVIIFFGFNINSNINTLGSLQNNNTVLVEVLTEFCATNNLINYGIFIDWQKAVQQALNSNEFDNFLNKEKTNKSENIINYYVKYKNSVFIKKYR